MPTTSPRAATQGPRSQRKRPGDLTGVNTQRLEAERDEAAQEEADARAQAEHDDRVEKLTTVVDVSETPNGRRETPHAEVVQEEVEATPKTMLIRVNYPIEQMTFGREVVQEAEYDEQGVCTKAAILGGMLTYDFEEGQQYRVPWALGMHLKSLGYVYDF